MLIRRGCSRSRRFLKMRKVTLQRTNDDGTQTVGILSTDNFQCRTLELPFLDNQHNISCIPSGVYICKWSQSNRLSLKLGRPVFTYEVLNVPNRTGIRCHSSSFVSDLRGCISLGSDYQDIDGDGHLDLINSRITVNRFNELLNKEDFELTITNAPSA